MSPGRVVDGHADHELTDRSRRGRSSGTPPTREIPLACDQPPVPGEYCRRGHGEHHGPPLPGDQPGQGREPQPVGWLVAGTADLSTQHCVLVPEHQEFGIFGGFPPGQHNQTAEQTTNDQVEDRKDHSGMVPVHNSGQARSSNRAPHGAEIMGELFAGT